MDRNEMHRMVEYIRIQPEFPFDMVNVEQDIELVLAFYGFCRDLDNEEKQEVTRCLLPMAASGELAEIGHVIEQAHGHSGLDEHSSEWEGL